MLGELSTAAPTMGRLAKTRYTHDDMIDFIIANPGISQNSLAARYGYTPAWVSNIMASDAWQAKMAARREQLVDPTLVASLNERFAALAERSVTRLMERLDAPQVPDNVLLRAAELGAKGCGQIGAVASSQTPPPPSGVDHLAQLANRLLDLQSKIRTIPQGATIEGTAETVPQGT